MKIEFCYPDIDRKGRGVMLTKEFHKSRREALLNLMEDNSMAFIFAGTEKEDRGDQMHPFTPYADFYYMTGFNQPKAVLMLTKIKGAKKEALFIHHTDEMMARWQGVNYTKESVKEETGMENVQYLEKFEASIPVFGRRNEISHFYIDIANWEEDFTENQAQKFARKVCSHYPYLQVHNLAGEIALMRQVKSQEEINCHKKACNITTQGVQHILKTLRPGMYEYEIEAEFDYILGKNHARHAFSTIAASGKNACVLHYVKNDRKMNADDLILFDLGAEWEYYASDVSRTFPVGGKFTDRQKALYNVVLKGLEAAIAATKPGQPKNELQNISKAVMAEELMKLHMISKPEEINRYYFHSSGHYIGLYTHDVGNDDALLEENMMFTLEPGLYFEKLGIGIRIEDTILITKDGCQVLTAGIPKTTDEIEAYMAKYNYSQAENKE
jgi:Xaa-Pro aminopeptidase